MLMDRAPAGSLATVRRALHPHPCLLTSRSNFSHRNRQPSHVTAARKAKAVDPLVKQFKDEYDIETLEIMDMRYNYNLRDYLMLLRELVYRVGELAEQGKALSASDASNLLRSMKPRSGCTLEFLELYEHCEPWHNWIPPYKDIRTLDRGVALNQVFEGEDEATSFVGGATLNQLAILLGYTLRVLARSVQVTRRGAAKDVPTKMLLLPLLLETHVLDNPSITHHAKQLAPQVLVDAIAECAARRAELSASKDGTEMSPPSQLDMKNLPAGEMTIGEALQQGVDEYNKCVDAMLNMYGETGLASFLNISGLGTAKDLFWLPSCWEALMEFWGPRMTIKDSELLAYQVCNASSSAVLTEEEHRDLLACAGRILHLLEERAEAQLASTTSKKAASGSSKPPQPQYVHILDACKALLQRLVYAKGLGDEEDGDRVEEHPLRGHVAEVMPIVVKLAKVESAGNTTALNKALNEAVGAYGTLAELCKAEKVKI